MTTTGYVIFALGFACYLKWVQVIWRLVAESNRVSPESHFSLFWWFPAWKLHRKAFPTSGLRRQIVVLYFVTFILMMVATGFIAYARIEQFRMAH